MEEGNQLLCIAKKDDSTGKVEAATVKEALDNWGISDGIIASCFDTTSSNTGIYSSSTVLLQQDLNRQLLWLSCRHHIPELILKAAFQTASLLLHPSLTVRCLPPSTSETHLVPHRGVHPHCSLQSCPGDRNLQPAC